MLESLAPISRDLWKLSIKLKPTAHSLRGETQPSAYNLTLDVTFSLHMGAPIHCSIKESVVGKVQTTRTFEIKSIDIQRAMWTVQVLIIVIIIFPHITLLWVRFIAATLTQTDEEMR